MPKNTKRKDGETVAPVEPEDVQPSSQDTTGDPGKQYNDAQQQFARTTNEADLKVHNILLNAYREYVTRLHDSQHEFEGYALEAYQNYLAKLYQASGPGVAGDTGNDHYREFVRLTTELSTQSGLRESAEGAYRDLAATFALTENQADVVVRRAEAYRAYVEHLTEARKQAEPVQRQAEQAYWAYVRDWKDGVAQGKTALESAYQDYLNDLNEAYVRSDLENRASAAAKNYLATAEEACKQSQTVHEDAAKALIETQEQVLRNVRHEQS
jgi:hypothetical protein